MPAARSSTSVASDAAAPRRLSIGKLRGLQQMADADGILAMCAMDHRGSMQRLIRPDAPEAVEYEELVKYKLDLTRALAPHATAVLLDPIYGAAQAISAGKLPASTGLLVSLEETGYETEAQGRVTTLLSGWSAQKVRRMGASAVKILLYYRPDLEENAARQREVVRRVAEACAEVDLPFLLEPIVYPVFESERDPAFFASLKGELVVRSARDLTPLGVDVLKSEFPEDLRYQQDEDRLREACERLDDASRVPWILLSAGVTFEEFERQVEIACRAGASGFLCVRAVWEEAMRIPDGSDRRRWLSSIGVERLRRLHGLAAEHGSPWWRNWGSSPADAGGAISETWHRGY